MYSTVLWLHLSGLASRRMRHEIVRAVGIATLAAAIGYGMAVGTFFLGSWYLDAHGDDVFGQPHTKAT